MNKQIEELNKLLLSDDFTELTEKSDKFNIFRALKLQNAEVRHSSFLGWLLSPSETHKLGDCFLKNLIKIVIKDHLNEPNLKLNSTDMIFNDFSDAEVTLEKFTDKGRRMDIFIDSPRNNFICVIENKIWSSEGCNQLEDYFDFIEHHEIYSKYKNKMFVFLTPHKDYDSSCLYKNYVQIDYDKICEVIDKVLKTKKDSMSSNIKIFIEDYKQMVRKDVMNNVDEQTVKLCRRIYREHKEAIDLINKNALSIENEIRDTLTTIVLKNDDFVSTGWNSGEYIEFYQKNISEKYAYSKNDNQLRVYYLFYQKNRSIDFILWISRSTKENREIVYNILKENENKLTNCTLNALTGNKVEKAITMSFITQNDYDNLEEISPNELEQELQTRFSNIYKSTLKSIVGIFNENIDKLPM